MEIPNFLTDEECDQLIRLYDQKESIPQPDNYWEGRVRFVKREDIDSDLSHKLYVTRVVKSRQHFGEFMWLDETKESIQLVKWPKGYKMTPHSDYGVVNEFPYREFASIIYLNDDYKGGELILPKERIKMKPKKGTLITFRGGKVWHGVAEVKEGTRYTCICWYSVEPK